MVVVMMRPDVVIASLEGLVVLMVSMSSAIRLVHWRSLRIVVLRMPVLLLLLIVHHVHLTLHLEMMVIIVVMILGTSMMWHRRRQWRWRAILLIGVKS